MNLKKKRKIDIPESEIQEACHDKLNDLGIKYIHLCADTYRKTGGHYKGVPDLLIFHPNGEYNSCMLLELKKLKGKLTQGQITWHKGVNVQVAYGLEEALDMIDGFVNYIDQLV